MERAKGRQVGDGPREVGRGQMLRGSVGHTQMFLCITKALGSKGREFVGWFVCVLLFSTF